MIDTHFRKYGNFIFERTGRTFISIGLTPKVVTILALGLGLCASGAFYFDNVWLSITLLWLSGFLDAVDGQMARILKTSSNTGALMDIVFDRVVELSFILVLGLKFPEDNFTFMLLLASIVLSMTVFLTVGALSNKSTEKAFYYQAGLMERTETFLFFTGLMIFSELVGVLALIFAICIFFTAGQRMVEGISQLGRD